MTATSDVAVRRTAPTALVEQSMDEFAKVLPSHVRPEVFARLAVGALRRDPNLMRVAEQNLPSLMHALLDAARLGLEPGTSEYYLTPRGGKNPAVLGVVGYQGEVELIYRAGAVSSVKAEVVHEGDVFEFDPSMGRPVHRPDWFSDRGSVLGAYAYAEMAGGGVSKVVIIGPAEIARAMAASPTAGSSHSPWSTDYAAMVLKTAVHRLAKWVPTSAEYRREMLRSAAAAAAGEAQTMETPPPFSTPTPAAQVFQDEVVDAVIVEDPA